MHLMRASAVSMPEWLACNSIHWNCVGHLACRLTQGPTALGISDSPNESYQG